jgi:hypothetical protein
MNTRRVLRLALASTALGLAPLAGPAQAQGSATASSRVDYSDPAAWLCLPGRQDACAVDQSTTVLLAGGASSPEPWQPHVSPAVDCFYVYPTVSQEPTPNSSLMAGSGERNVVVSQLTRFASQCRTFAPLYRQVTLAALRAGIAGQNAGPDREMAYRDVVDAWNSYLSRDNQGRGVVLIGHSQGSGVLRRLIAEEIEGKPIQNRIVSALLIGTNVLVPEGRDVGGDLKVMPLCRSRSQTGCVVTYVSFRDDLPPPENSRFGRTTQPGMQVACTNPAALGGGRAELKAYMTSARPATSPWVTGGSAVATPFVRPVGMFTAECVRNEHGSYLAVSIHPDPSGRRTGEITNYVRTANGQIDLTWGLHLADVPLAMGDLVDLVAEQSRAYLARTR